MVSGTAEISVMVISLKFWFLRFIRSAINQSLSPISMFEAVGINTTEVSSGFLPTNSNKALTIEGLVRTSGGEEEFHKVIIAE